MDKRYYFRGLGLGIIVTAVIMGIALPGGSKRELTDDEVIARAKALGMTENTTLLEPTDSDENQGEQEPAAEEEAVKKDVAVAQPKDDPEKSAEDEKKPTNGAGSKPQEKSPAQAESAKSQKPAADTNEMTKQDEDTGQKNPAGEKTSQQAVSAKSVTIVNGDSSYTVAKKLEEAGIVSSASAYDDYLCQNGFDKRLRAGTFRIPEDAGDEQIARIVTGQQE